MRRLDDWFGTARVAIVGAEPQRVLNRLAAQGILFWDILRRDELTLELTVYRGSLERCRRAALRCLCEPELLELRGLRVELAGLRRRPVLLIGLLLAVLTVLWSQNYIWTLEVQGNETVPSQEILRCLSELGVGVGTRRSEVDPQGLENRMLDRMPALSWLTVNANSARAVVLVREREPKPELVDTREPTNVVAVRDGLIDTMEVYEGLAMAAPGELVRRGQLLVSGVSAAFRTTVLHHAMAEVYARTWRETEILSLRQAQIKSYTGRTGVRWRLRVGNKFMNLYETSGIPTDCCDRIVTDYPLKLPGGVCLPITLERTTMRCYTLQPTERPLEGLRQRLLAEYTRCVLEGTVAGTIRDLRAELTEDDKLRRLRVVCECLEQIGALAPILNAQKEDACG